VTFFQTTEEFSRFTVGILNFLVANGPRYKLNYIKKTVKCSASLLRTVHLNLEGKILNKKTNDKIICPEPLKLVTEEEETVNDVKINFTTDPLFLSGQ
jgi:hypothetical protein